MMPSPSAATPRQAAIIAWVGEHRRWMLLGALILLHLVILQGAESAVGRTLMACHLGLFLLWQPVVRAERRLTTPQLLIFSLGVALFVGLLSHWLLMVWAMALAGMVGGKVFFFAARWSRLFHLLALGYLVLLLLVVLMGAVIPKPFALPPDFATLAKYGLPLVFPAMAVLPIRSEPRGGPEVIDLFSSMFLVLLLAVLLLGSLAFMLLLERNYLESLFFTLLAIAGMLLLLGWAWNPKIGFSGVGVLFTRYVLSVGLPFEQWLHHLAEHAMREPDPSRFLDEAFAGMARLPWVSGGRWHAEGIEGVFGQCVGNCTQFDNGPLHLSLYTEQALTPALQWHFNLLARLLAEFYTAKQQARRLQEMSYIQAIHETGARLTHDVKNLLQSLNTLCFAAMQESNEASPEFQALLRRQLPMIAQRLEQTLDKLKKPEETDGPRSDAALWWHELQRRYSGQPVAFEAPEGMHGLTIPAALFSSVCENLLQNATDKRALHPALRVAVRFVRTPVPALQVWDDGPPVPSALATEMFRGPLPSESGFGIGLYQMGRQAEREGYELALRRNETGAVCFELAPKPARPLTPA